MVLILATTISFFIVCDLVVQKDIPKKRCFIFLSKNVTWLKHSAIVFRDGPVCIWGGGGGGSSLHVCWEELEYPTFDQVHVVRYKLQPPLRILDLSYTPHSIAAMIKEYDSNKNGRSIRDASIRKDFCLVVSRAVCWPIIAASSVRVFKPEGKFTPKDSFKPEYIIPQQMLQWVVQERKDIDAIRYFSTKMDPHSRDSILQTNYVFPARTLAPTGHCSTLKSKFRLTHPISWTLLSSPVFPRSLRGGIKSLNELQDIILNGIKMKYTSTPFWDNELKLNSMHTSQLT